MIEGLNWYFYQKFNFHKVLRSKLHCCRVSASHWRSEGQCKKLKSWCGPTGAKTPSATPTCGRSGTSWTWPRWRWRGWSRSWWPKASNPHPTTTSSAIKSPTLLPPPPHITSRSIRGELLIYSQIIFKIDFLFFCQTTTTQSLKSFICCSFPQFLKWSVQN